MSCSLRPAPSFTRWAIVVIATLLALLCVPPAVAQKTDSSSSSPPKYDLKTETKMKATVEDVKLPPKGSDKLPAHLMIKSASETLDVYLCPEDFLEDMGITFSKGDEIALTGSKVKDEGADLLLAREVTKGNDTLVLRDDKGNPVWNFKR